MFSSLSLLCPDCPIGNQLEIQYLIITLITSQLPALQLPFIIGQNIYSNMTGYDS